MYAESFQSCLTLQLCGPLPERLLYPWSLKKEYWGGLPCPPPGDLPDTRIEPKFLTSSALCVCV